MEGKHVHDEDIRMKFAKSKFLSGKFYPELSDHDRPRNRIKAPETRNLVLHEHKV